MSPEQEERLFKSIGSLESGQNEIHHRINRLADDVEEVTKATARTRDAVESYATNTVTRIVALEQAAVPKVETGATNREDRDALEVGRTLKGLPKVLTLAGKNVQAIVLLLIVCLLAWRELRGQAQSSQPTRQAATWGPTAPAESGHRHFRPMTPSE